MLGNANCGNRVTLNMKGKDGIKISEMTGKNQ